MAKPASRSYSRYSREAARLLGVMIHTARVERKETIAELAARAGVSPGLVHRIENGDMGCSIGAVFELAAIVGLPLFDSDPMTMSHHLSMAHDKLTLLPKAVRHGGAAVNDEF